VIRGYAVLVSLSLASCAIVNTSVTLNKPMCLKLSKYYIELKLEEFVRGSKHTPFDYSNTSKFDAIIKLSFDSEEFVVTADKIDVEQNSQRVDNKSGVVKISTDYIYIDIILNGHQIEKRIDKSNILLECSSDT
jgi:hypothetical protein